MSHTQPLFDLSLDAADLMRRHPPRWTYRNKILVQQQSCPDGATFGGTIRVCRWPSSYIRAVRLLERSQIEKISGPFAYEDPPGPERSWYPNFADPDLFCFGLGPLLAQDELQVAEHPSLAAVRAELLARGLSTFTIDPTDRLPTPFTLEGVERRVAIDVMPSDARPLGLYGNTFSRAPEREVLAATRRLDPPSISDIFAMAAPVGGSGPYTSMQIDWILTAAYTTFAAVVARSEGAPVRLHTGFWGCGAFGGNRALMALLQLIAAGSAGVHRVCFHSFSGGDTSALDEAISLMSRLAPAGDDPSAWVVAVHKLGLCWGVSDGN